MKLTMRGEAIDALRGALRDAEIELGRKAADCDLDHHAYLEAAQADLRALHSALGELKAGAAKVVEVSPTYTDADGRVY